MKIQPFIHRCEAATTVSPVTGEGPKVTIPVTLHTPVQTWDFDAGARCLNCRRQLATDHEMLSHIYRELMGEEAK